MLPHHNLLWIIIPAAGSSSRMSAKVQKPYLLLKGKPILQHAVELFSAWPGVQKIVVALSPKDKTWHTAPWLEHPLITIIAGGKTRAQSVWNALVELKKHVHPKDWVIVHDAARPCLTPDDLTKLIHALEHHPVGGLLGIPVVDTLKQIDDTGHSVKTLNRQTLWQAQTPQMFRFEALYPALKKAIENNIPVTDEAQTVELDNLKPLMVSGSRHNIKITFPEDLLMAEGLRSSPVSKFPHTMPKHVAIILDGNGRWAQSRNKFRIEGHRAGLLAVRKIVTFCVQKKIPVLTLFAFSSENWQRPQEEVRFLMKLFQIALKQEISNIIKNNIQIKFIGDRAAFSEKLQRQMADIENKTHAYLGLKLRIAANYGGQWDILQAASRWADKRKQGTFPTREEFRQYLSLNDVPDPDLFIRTGNEQRISNFLLWQLAYTELYFTDLLWPDFDEQALEQAILCYGKRERRYGKITEHAH